MSATGDGVTGCPSHTSFVPELLSTHSDGVEL